MCVFCADDTLSLIRDPRKAERLRRLYRTYGAAMVASPLVVVGLTYVLQPGARVPARVFFVEAVAVLTFAAYWLTKSLELRATGAEELAMQHKLRRASKPPPGVQRNPGRVVQIWAARDSDIEAASRPSSRAE